MFKFNFNFSLNVNFRNSVEEVSLSLIVDSNCPICFDNMHNSVLQIIRLKCGHYMHHACFMGLIESSYTCPTCMKAVVDLDPINIIMDQEVHAHPMPEEYSIDTQIMCNECLTVSTVKFHIIGMKCGECGCYNTKRI